MSRRLLLPIACALAAVPSAAHGAQTVGQVASSLLESTCSNSAFTLYQHGTSGGERRP